MCPTQPKQKSYIHCCLTDPNTQKPATPYIHFLADRNFLQHQPISRPPSRTFLFLFAGGGGSPADAPPPGEASTAPPSRKSSGVVSDGDLRLEEKVDAPIPAPSPPPIVVAAATALAAAAADATTADAPGPEAALAAPNESAPPTSMLFTSGSGMEQWAESVAPPAAADTDSGLDSTGLLATPLLAAEVIAAAVLVPAACSWYCCRRKDDGSDPAPGPMTVFADPALIPPWIGAGDAGEGEGAGEDASAALLAPPPLLGGENRLANGTTPASRPPCTPPPPAAVAAATAATISVSPSAMPSPPSFSDAAAISSNTFARSFWTCESDEAQIQQAVGTVGRY